ncbi:hypothetical protein APHAL10511_001667 [Amanita phalloides]|nr:hypothetical protein APHAL10511_001667 [Amanita phalloides]
MLATAATLSLILVLPFQSYLLNSSSCLSDSFYGNFRDGNVLRSIFKISPRQRDCFDALTVLTDKILIPYEPQQLVWLELAEIDATLQTQDIFNPESWLANVLRPARSVLQLGDPVQEHFISRPEIENIVWASNKAALVSISPLLSKELDLHLPQYWKSTLLPSLPTMHHPVPPSSVQRIQKVVSHLHFDPVVASTVNNISLSQMKDDIGFLTGEDGKSGIVSRHSFSHGAQIAAKWLKERFEETGATCHLEPFLFGFAPNVICHYDAMEETDDVIILGAHYDSRGSFGFMRAPGANDDGSGTTSLLSIARTIARKNIKFRSNVYLCAFAGEEQGLRGSRAYAYQLKQHKTNVTLMIQADMLAYRAYQEPPQLGLPDLIGSPVAAELVTKVASIYSPELHVDFTPVCCSDHQSFHEQGYVATHLFERAGPIMDPMYHNSGDVRDREGYDFDQLRSIAKVQLATLLHTAGYEIL